MELARLPRIYAGPPLRQVGVPDLDEATTRGLWLLFGGAALVFVALCTNVCGLVLSVLAARRRELGSAQRSAPRVPVSSGKRSSSIRS